MGLKNSYIFSLYPIENCTTSHSPTHTRKSSNEGLYDIQAEADEEFLKTVAKDVEMFTKLGIIVDFDGTLSYLAKTPGYTLNKTLL